MSGSPFTDFGQKVDLTASIRNILRNYPEGTAVLKELVQNADDAGARTVAFTLDCRDHGTDAVISPDMKQFQGPALLCYNDAIFTEEDFKSIQRIGDSLKKTSEDQAKIGRFGIGFNAVYHWTDLPSFVSSNFLVMLDPQARFLPNVNPSNPGKMVDWMKSREVLETFRDQFLPYGLDFSASFQGTLFRLPLRTPEQATTSSLSKRSLSVDEARSLLSSLQHEASAMLLFLKNIETIEIHVWEAGASARTVNFRCSISNISAELRKKRSFVKDAPRLLLQHQQQSKVATAEMSADYSLFIDCSTGAADSNYQEQWEVCNQLGGAGATAIATDPANALLRLVPWGGLAACVTPRSAGSDSGQLLGGLAYCFLPLPVRTGLPVMVNGFFELSSNRRDVWQAGVDMTGDGKTRAEWNLCLMRGVIGPSYVRLLLRLRDALGFSIVFQSMWPSIKVQAPWDEVSKACLRGCSDKRLLRIYTSTAAAEIASNAVVSVSSSSGTSGGDVMLDAAKMVMQTPSAIFGGLSSLLVSASPGVEAKSGGDSAPPAWVACSSAILLPSSSSFGLSADGEELQLVAFLAAAGQPVVVCLPALREALEDSRACTLVASPALVRDVLRDPVKLRRSLPAPTTALLTRSPSTSQAPNSYTPTATTCTFLLRYCLFDLKPEAPQALDTLSLLPLGDGTTSSIRIYTQHQASAIKNVCGMGFSLHKAVMVLARSDWDVARACETLTTGAASTASNVASSGSVSIVIVPSDDEQRVFSLASPMLLDKNLVGPAQRAFLQHVNMQQTSNIRPLDAALVPDLLRYILPAECGDPQGPVLLSSCKFPSNSNTAASSSSSGGGEALKVFLRSFWQYAASRPDVISSCSQGCAILLALGWDAKAQAINTNLATLCAVSRLSHLIVASKGDVALPNDVLVILQTLGLRVVDPECLPAQAAMPPCFWEFVHNPSRSGVLSALDVLVRSSSRAELVFAPLTRDQRDALRLYLATCEPVNGLSQQELSVVRRLPIFTNYNSTEKSADLPSHWSLSSSSPTGANKNAGSAQLDRPFATLANTERLSHTLFPSHFIAHTLKTPQDLQLLQALGVKILTRGDYFCTELLPNISALHQTNSSDAEVSILAMLMELKSLVEESGGNRIVGLLQSTAFLASGSAVAVGESAATTVAKLCRPCDLYDPQERELRTLLPDSFFPAPIYQREDILVFLRSVGLQQTFAWPGVIACARTIAEMPTRNSTEIAAKSTQGRCLLTFLDKNCASLLGEDKKKSEGAFGLFSSLGKSLFGDKAPVDKTPIEHYVQALVATPWVPVLTKPLHACMPWPSPQIDGAEETECTACPADTRPKSDAWLCSASRHITAVAISSPSLQRLFRYDQPIPTRTIAIQLLELARRYLELDPTRASMEGGGATSERLKSQPDAAEKASLLQSARETVTGLIPQLYQRLNAVETPKDSSDIVALLEGHAWIWVGETFVGPDKVALGAAGGGSGCAPYLYQLPQDLRVYSNLLQTFKVKSVFSARDYIQVLRAMAADSRSAVANGTSSTDGNKAIPEQPLSDAHIDLAVSLVTLLSAEGSLSASAQREMVYIPDASGRLALSTELVNDDVPWMSGPEYISVRSGCRLIHPNISSLVAQKMGVKSLRLALVTKSVEQSLFAVEGGSSGVAVESFGQAESLTSRLRTILDLYPDGNPIFSELLQNADDAGASTVRILLDENSYGVESLLDSRMAPLQGPALLVCNDAVFTEADYRSLARIGHGSKLEKLATTGRFGLGFNSTYHLTDTPTFVSGDYLVIFDPHCTHAPGATAAQPGLRIRFPGSGLSSTFTDQFAPFRYFGCDFTSNFPGTLFRFPLRSAAMARKSEISSRSYSVADVQANLLTLTQQLGNHIMFLRSVRCVEIYSLPPSTDDGSPRVPVLLNRATRSVSNVEPINSNSQNLMRFFDKRDTKGVQLTRDEFYSELSSTPDSKLPGLSSHVNINIESFDPSSATQQEVEFLVVTGLQGGEAKRLACDPCNRHLKLIPLGGVAACLNRTQGSGSDCTELTSTQLTYPSLPGQAFCFLPLPVQTHLPVHLNAYWELSSNRRDIWQGADTQGEAKLRSDWNGFVMKDILAPLYAALLNKVAQLEPRGPGGNVSAAGASGGAYATLSLLPCPLPSDLWTGVSTALFPLLRKQSILWSRLDGGRYITLESAWLLGGAAAANNANNITEEKEKSRLEELLLRENLAVAVIPPLFLRPLLDSGACAGEVTPALVRHHFRNNNIPHPALLRLDDAIFLLQFSFRDINGSNDGAYGNVVGLPLLPLENGKLGVIHSNTAPEALYLVSEAERRILQAGAGSRVVAADSVLGPAVSACLRDEAFAKSCNVRPLQPTDLVPLLSQFIPHGWFDPSTSLADRTTVPILTADWLAALWTYLDSGGKPYVDLVRESFPCLPVIAASLPKTSEKTAQATAYLARVSESIPVLHHTLRDVIPDSAAHALSQIGIYIFDAAALGATTQHHGLAYSKQLAALLCPPSPKGIIAALVSVCKRPESSSLGAMWSRQSRLSVRDLILDEVLARLGEVSSGSGVLDVAEAECLRSLPVWQRHGVAADAEGSEGFCPINMLQEDGDSTSTSSLCLPPRGVDASLLSRDYIVLRTERDRPLYRLLSLTEPSKGVFYKNYIVPAIHAMSAQSAPPTGPRPSPAKAAKFSGLPDVPANLIDGLVVTLLRDLHDMEAEAPGISALVSESRIIRCGATATTATGIGLVAPCDLYDPHAPGLRDLLPPEAFPSQQYHDPSLLMALRTLGLNSTMTCNGILQAARAIQTSFESLQKRKRERKLSQATANDGKSAIENFSAVEDEAAKKEQEDEEASQQRAQAGIVKRANGLVKYLDGSTEALLKEADPEGLSEFMAPSNETAETMEIHAPNPSRAGAATPNSSILGGAWSKELRSLTWVPAYMYPPVRSQTVGEEYSGPLPWPTQTHVMPGPLAAPSQCCHQVDMWLCTSTTRVSSAEVNSPLLRQLLGWRKPISGRSVALQLLAVAETFEKTPVATRGTHSSALNSAFHKLLTSLQSALDRESSKEADIWINVLKQKAVLWLGGGFVEPARVAFRALSSVNTEPFLYLVPTDMTSYSALLRRLGVKEAFGPPDLAGMMRELHSGQSNRPLSVSQVEVSVGILKLLVRLLAGGGVQETQAAAITEEGGEAAVAVAVAVAVPVDGSSVDVTESIPLPQPPNKPPKPAGSLPPAPPAFTLAELGPIYVPDSAGALALVTSCSFDDAPWISALLVQKGSNIRFTHQLLGPDALSLGARSLRMQLFAGDEMVCPDSGKLNQLLQSDGLFEALCDVLSLADALGAHSLSVMYDTRSHARESLMHPGLASAQGRAIMLHLDGPVLGSEEIAQAISDLPIYSYLNKERDLEDRGYAAQAGKKLVSSFAVTDCLQIVSGKEFFLFDPTGTFLLSDDRSSAAAGKGTQAGGKAGAPSKGAKAEPPKRNIGRAQRCFLVGGPGGAESGVLNRFPDQFEPFLSAPFGLRRALNDRTGISGMLIRLPLRDTGSAISATVATEAAVKEAFQRFVPVMQGALVLGGSLMKCSLMHEGGTQMATNTSSAGEQPEPEFITDTSASLLSNPSKRNSRRELLQENGWKRNALTSLFTTFTPPELCYMVTINTRIQNGWLNTGSGEGAHTSDWLLLSTIGAGRIKDEALKDPYRSFQLRPFITLAARLLSAEELASSQAPDRGLFFTSGGAVGVSGLPFHVEGAFLQDSHERSVPLSETTSSSASGQTTARRALTLPHPKGPTEAGMSRANIAAWNRALLQTIFEVLVPRMMRELTNGEAARAPSAAVGQQPQRRTSVAGFYKHWPFLSRMTEIVSTVATGTRMLTSLAGQSLFLTREGFVPLEKALLVMPILSGGAGSQLSSDILRYLQVLLPVCLSPEQLALDLSTAGIRYTSLGPARLREALKGDQPTQCARLRGRYELVLPLLSYCLSDMARSSLQQQGEFVKRKAYKEMGGVPLLPMSDGGIKCFPRSARERVCLAPVCLHALLPGLRGSFVHPTALGGLSAPASAESSVADATSSPSQSSPLALLEDALFRDTVFVSTFSAAFLKDCMQHVLPAEWERCAAVSWVSDSALSRRAVGRGIAIAASASANASAAGDAKEASRPSLGANYELLLFVLWRDALSKEALLSDVQALAQWPLVPVISKGRRVLMQSSWLQHVFSVQPSDAEDAARRHWGIESSRMASLVLSDSPRNPVANSNGPSSSAGWEWTTLPHEHPSLSDYLQSGSRIATAITTSGPSGERTAVVEAQAVAGGNETITEGLSSMLAAAGIDSGADAVAVPVMAAATAQWEQQDVDTAVFEEPAEEAEGGSTVVPTMLHRLICRLGLPLLDGSILDGTPACLSDPAVTSTLNSGTGGGWGRKLLNALHAFSLSSVLITTYSTTGASDEPLLDFDSWTVVDRQEILMTILESHRAQPLVPAEIDKLKNLRVFTESGESNSAGRAVALAECTGAYWCSNLSVLDGLQLSALGGSNVPAAVATSSSSALPSAAATGKSVILLHDPQLVPVYQLLGVEELTPTIAVRRFTLPSLLAGNGGAVGGGMDDGGRLRIMQGLAGRWAIFRGDDDLVRQLNEVAFVPSWTWDAATDSSDGNAQSRSASTNSSRHGPYRRPSELLSWSNARLLSALSGPQQPAYFAPPSLRTPEMLIMLTDLGMSATLTKEVFSRIALDIQDTAKKAERSESGNSASLGKQEALQRGRAILRYVKDMDLGVGLFQDKETARTLADVAFVPIMVPVEVSSGGHVTYRAEVGRFSQCLSKQGGTLAFTLMPVLDEDICPHQIFHSSLEITSTPPMDMVLKHIRLLTQNGEGTSVDRWNAEHYSVRHAFGQLFSYLQDRWKDVPSATRRELRSLPIVPVGHLLIKPARVFFRLSEDLSPFMHEIPRYFGVHEGFLKTCLGVKEAPSSLDYSLFLRDLAEETRGNALNPNELRATVAIVQSVALDLGEGQNSAQDQSSSGSSGSSGAGGASSSSSSSANASVLQSLFVPDENSVLRAAGQCLLNDDPWMRARAGDDVRSRMGLHILHPALADPSIVTGLGINSLSRVLVERANVASLTLHDTHSQLEARFRACLEDSGVIEAVAALATKASSGVSGASGGGGGGGAGVTASASGGPQLTVNIANSNVSVATDGQSSSGAEMLILRLQLLALRFVNALPTRLVMCDPRQPHAAGIDLEGDASEGGSASAAGQDQALAYVDSAAVGGRAVVYVNVGLVRAPLTVEVAVSLGLCRLLALDTSLAATLACLLAVVPESPRAPVGSTNTSSTTRVLHLLRVGSDTVTVREKARGQPGERLTSTDQALLELKPFRVFRLGEVVAYDAAAVGAAASSAMPSESDDPFSGLDNHGNALPAGAARATDPTGTDIRYAQVISCDQEGLDEEDSPGQSSASAGANSNDHGVRRLVIKGRGGRSVALLSTSVYSFKAGREGAARQAPSPSPSSSLAVTPNGKTTQAVSAGGSPRAEVPQALPLDPVRPDEVLGALHGLLRRAGLPIELDSSSLMQRVLELEASHRQLEGELASERQALVGAQERIVRNAAQLSCQVCFNKNVEKVMAPCGHTVCEECMTHLGSRCKCPFCRANVTLWVNLFLPQAPSAND